MDLDSGGQLVKSERRVEAAYLLKQEEGMSDSPRIIHLSRRSTRTKRAGFGVRTLRLRGRRYRHSARKKRSLLKVRCKRSGKSADHWRADRSTQALLRSNVGCERTDRSRRKSLSPTTSGDRSEYFREISSWPDSAQRIWSVALTHRNCHVLHDSGGLSLVWFVARMEMRGSSEARVSPAAGCSWMPRTWIPKPVACSGSCLDHHADRRGRTSITKFRSSE